VTPLAHFDATWNRCAQLSTLHAYLENNVAAVMQPDELLRAEWVARVSALDLYVHELVAQKMVATFEGHRPPTPAFLRFQISADTLGRIRAATTASEATAAFDLHVRECLSRITYQFPDDIAEGIRLCSSVELWNEVALHTGATQANKNAVAKSLKTDLSLVIRRRNAIAHEGDLQQSATREPWPISRADLILVKDKIDSIVRAIDAVVT
jgi:hypothetical protein